MSLKSGNKTNTVSIISYVLPELMIPRKGADWRTRPHRGLLFPHHLLSPLSQGKAFLTHHVHRQQQNPTEQRPIIHTEPRQEKTGNCEAAGATELKTRRKEREGRNKGSASGDIVFAIWLHDASLESRTKASVWGKDE